MFSAIKANPIGLLLYGKDAREMAMTAAKTNLVEEVEDCANNTHKSTPLPFESLKAMNEKTALRQQANPQKLDVG